MTFTQKRELIDLTDEECFCIAQIVTNKTAESLIHLTKNKYTDRIIIYCNNDTEVIDMAGTMWIEYRKKEQGIWKVQCIYNYLNLINYLFDIGVLSLKKISDKV